jgi:hypothetical protein
VDVNSDGWIYLPVRVRSEGGDPVLQLDNLASSSAAGGEGTNLSPALAGLVRKVTVNYGPQTEQLLQQLNAKLNRDLGNGLRSEGHFDAAGVEHVSLLKDGVQLVIRIAGDLSITYTP